MDLINLALLFVAIAVVALVPVGCIMTRGQGPRGVTTSAH